MSDYVKNPTYTDFKESVRACPTASININLPGTVMDGVTMAYGDRVLLRVQGAPAFNGIYNWLGATTPMQRASGGIDHQMSSGMLVPVEEGTVNADKIFQLVTDSPIETGETPLSFQEFGSGAAAISTLLTDNNTWAGINTWTDTSTFQDQVVVDGPSGGYVTVSDVTGTDTTQLAGTDISFSTGLASTTVMSSKVSTDAAPRFTLDESGLIAWGDGTGSTDVSIERTTFFGSELSVKGGLRIDGDNGGFGVVSNANWFFETSLATSAILGGNQIGDANNRWALTNNGKMSWGNGTATPDTNLYRAGIGVLKSDGKIQSAAVPTFGDDLVNKTYADLISIQNLDDIPDIDTSGVVDGALLRFEGTGSVWEDTAAGAMLLSDAGKLILGTNGSGAGIQLGDDTQIYRDAANSIRTPDKLTVGDGLNVEQQFYATGGVRLSTSITFASTYAVDLVQGPHRIIAQSNANTILVTLPATHSAGQSVFVKRNGAFTVTVETADADTIDGSGSDFVIGTDLDSFEFVSDGGNWHVF